MKRTIQGARIGRPWIVGLVVVSGGLLLASSNASWYWLPLALLTVGGMAWVLVDRESESQTGGYRSNSNTAADREAALDALKQQYAVGEIDDVEFERRLETLLENETIADVENRIDTDSEAANEPKQGNRKTTEQAPHHRQKCRRRRKHHHGRH